MRETPRALPAGARLVVHHRIDDLDPVRWDALAGTGAVIRSHGYLRAVAAAGLNDCTYYYPVIEAADGRLLAHCCVYTITTDLLQILPSALQPAARALRRLWPGFLQVKITESASPHVIGHSFSFAAGEDETTLLLALESAIAGIARDTGSPLIVVRDFLAHEQPRFEALGERGYTRVSNLPQARIPLRWATYADYLQAMRSRYRKDLGRRLRRAAALGQTVRRLASFGERAEACARQVQLAHERSKGIKREVLNAAYYSELDRQLGARSVLLVAEREGRQVGHGMVLRDDAQLVATWFGREEGAPEDIWFQLLDEAVRMGYELGVRHLNLGLGSYAAKSLLGAVIEPQVCYCRSRYRALNWLMRRVPRTMERDLPPVHHIFRDDAAPATTAPR